MIRVSRPILIIGTVAGVFLLLAAYKMYWRPKKSTSQQVILSTSPLRISLDESFPMKDQNGVMLRRNFDFVAHDVLHTEQELFGNMHPADSRPIICSISSEAVPRTDATSDATKIKISLALSPAHLQRRNYCVFAFQLSHELGHVFMGPNRSNGLIETLADTVCHQTLDNLSTLYSQGDWHTYAPQFKAYHKFDQQTSLSTLPAKIQAAVGHKQWGVVTSYLKSQTKVLDQNPYCKQGFGLRTLGVVALRSGQVPYQHLVGVALLTDPTPREDARYRDDLPTQIWRAPQDAQQALKRLGR